MSPRTRCVQSSIPLPSGVGAHMADDESLLEVENFLEVENGHVGACHVRTEGLVLVGLHQILKEELCTFVVYKTT